MKLRSLICVSAVAAVSAAFALDGGNTFARLKVASDVKDSIIAIPFAGCGESTAEIYVTNLVMTTGLANGDTLMYNNGSAWYAWEIQGASGGTAGHWVGVSTSSKTTQTLATPAEEFKVACGKACWLLRSTTGSYYLYGQVTNVLQGVTVAGATSGNAVAYTIIAKPSESTPLDLNTWKGAATGIGNGDMLLVPDSSKATGQVTYKYNGSAWTAATLTTTSVTNARTKVVSEVTNTTWTAITSSVTIPAGKGFMYGRKNTEGATLAW